MIKLAPEHVGTRVLLSDGRVGYIGEWIEEKNLCNVVVEPGRWEYFAPDSGSNQSARSITLLLDAPNPLDVEVPDWCERIVGWHDDEGPTEIVPASRHRHWSKYPPDLRNLIKWSPAPGQMPPKNNEDIK